MGCIEVTKQRPCPICGKPDWCCFGYPSVGTEFVICKRADSAASDTIGTDGKLYKFLGLTKEDNAKFQEMEAWKESRDQWMRENHVGPYRQGSWNNYGSTDASSTIARPQKQTEYEIVDPVAVKPHVELDRFYRALLSVLVLDPKHRDYLKAEKWSDQLIQSSLVKSFPVKDVVRFNRKVYESKNFYRKRIAKAVLAKLSVNDLRGYPGAYLDHGGNWTLNGPSGIALPIYDADGYIYGLRIRMDFCDVDCSMELVDGVYQYVHDGVIYYHQPFKGFYHYENCEKISDGCKYYDDNGRLIEVNGKYRPMTSFVEDRHARENGRIVNRLSSGCQAENGISVYFNPAMDNPYVAYFTEGEKKGIFANAIMHVPVITFPGVSSWRSILTGQPGSRMIDKLKAKGVKICIVAYDADKETNAAVLRQQDAVVGALQQEGFSVGLANWPAKYGKGLDDLLANHNMPGFELLGS